MKGTIISICDNKSITTYLELLGVKIHDEEYLYYCSKNYKLKTKIWTAQCNLPDRTDRK